MPKVKCEHCKAVLNCEDRKLGQTVKCPKCGEQTSLIKPLKNVLENFTDPVDDPSVVEFYEDEIVEESKAGRAPSINPIRVSIPSKEEYRRQYTAIDSYAILLKVFGILMVLGSVGLLVFTFTADEVGLGLAYLGAAGVVTGLSFMVSSEMLTGFVNICVSTERSSDILESRN